MAAGRRHDPVRRLGWLLILMTDAYMLGEAIGWLIFRRFTRTAHRTATGKATP